MSEERANQHEGDLMPGLGRLYREAEGRSGDEPVIGGRPVNRWLFDLLTERGVLSDGVADLILDQIILQQEGWAQIKTAGTLALMGDRSTVEEVAQRVVTEAISNPSLGYVMPRIRLLETMIQGTLEVEKKAAVVEAMSRLVAVDQEGKAVVRDERIIGSVLRLYRHELVPNYFEPDDAWLGVVEVALEGILALAADRVSGRKALLHGWQIVDELELFEGRVPGLREWSQGYKSRVRELWRDYYGDVEEGGWDE